MAEIVIMLRWPFGCATPVCVDDNGNGDVDNIPGIKMAAHLLCQQLGAATYHSYGAVVSPPGAWPNAIDSGQMRCVGHEATVSAANRNARANRSFADAPMSSDESNHHNQLPPVVVHRVLVGVRLRYEQREQWHGRIASIPAVYSAESSLSLVVAYGRSN